MSSTHTTPTFSSDSSNPLHIDDCRTQRRAIDAGKIDFHALTRGHYPGKRMNSNTLPGLSSIGYWNSLTHQDWGLTPHHNEGIEISFQETGSNTFFVDDQQHELSPACLTITRPWQRHGIGNPFIRRGKLFWLILDVNVRHPNDPWSWPQWLILTPRDLRYLSRLLSNNPNPVWLATPRIRSIFSDIAQSIHSWPHHHSASHLTLSINHLFLELIHLLSSSHQPTLQPHPSRRLSAESFFQELSHSAKTCAHDWTIKSMAAHCNIGVTALAKYCRESVNLAPMAYLNHCRLSHVIHAFQQSPERSITDIALDHGFNSSQYFATLFKKTYHVTPTQFRQNPQSFRAVTLNPP